MISGCGGSGWLAENSRAQCTCTANLGKPPGRLVWRQANAGSDVTGNVGQTSLQMTSDPLSRGGRMFTCYVAWATNSVTASVTVQVGCKLNRFLHPRPKGGGGLYRFRSVCPSVCLFVCVVSAITAPKFTNLFQPKLDMHASHNSGSILTKIHGSNPHS
jgi:hypothetical protein